MGALFVASSATAGAVAELGALLPENPFATAGYFEFRRQVGYTSFVLGLADETGRLEQGCGAFLKTGRLNRTLEIPSLPAVDASSVFWEGVTRFCRHRGVTTLELGTFASPPGVEIPALGTRHRRADRCEFVIDLLCGPAPALSQSHRKNIRRAQRAGLVVRRSRSSDAAAAHLALMDQSMDRRRTRGESVGGPGPVRDMAALLGTGAAELFQAMRADTVLSSVLVLLAPRAGYSYYAGTSPEGMKASASHFLNDEIARLLRADGAVAYNLGGADPDSSLGSFKDGFGATRIHLPSAHCDVGPAWRRRIGRAIELVRSDRQALRRTVIGQMSRLEVYSADLTKSQLPESRPGLTFQALSAAELEGLAVGDPSFRKRQIDRLARFDRSYAYAVLVDGQVAHVSWLLPDAAMQRDVPLVVRPDPAVAEITGCETLAEFRGRGLYGVAIRNLLEVARGLGVRRVFMKTAADNTASQAGIAKAGLSRVGSAIVFDLPAFGKQVIWRRFR